MTALLTRLRQLDAAASPGPWSLDENDMRDEAQAFLSDHNGVSVGETYLMGRGGECEANADLITTLRNHLPEIIAALERVEGER